MRLVWNKYHRSIQPCFCTVAKQRLSLRYRQLDCFQFVLTCLICFISTNPATNNLNFADVPLRNEQTKKQTMLLSKVNL